MRADELRAISLFDGLADDQLAELAGGGTEVRIEPGVDLFLEGEHADFWWVLIDGAIDLLRHVGREDTVVGAMDVPGRWAGGFRAWDEHGVYLATGRGASQGRVLRVQAAVLRQRVRDWVPVRRHLTEGLYHTARSIESTARQRGWQLVRARSERAGGRGTQAGAGVGGEHPGCRHTPVRDQGIDPAHLRACFRHSVVLADGSCVDAAHRRDRRSREHPGHAWTQAPRRCGSGA